MPEKVVDKETKRLRKGIEDKIVKRKEGKKEYLDEIEIKKSSPKKQKVKRSLYEEEDDDEFYGEWEEFSF